MTRASDRLLDLLIVIAAASTIAYDVCLALRLRVEWAGVIALVVAVPAVVWLRRSPREPATVEEQPRAPLPTLPLALAVVSGAGAAALFAFSGVGWAVVWALWLVAAAAAFACGRPRSGKRAVEPRPEPEGNDRGGSGRAEVLVVAAWAVGLAVLSLVLLNPDSDDEFYVHLASWVAAHGRFPMHDTVFSSDRFPGLYFPPVWSYEPLAGAFARATSLQAGTVLYFVVTPVASFVCVLAVWRLLRAWRVSMCALALSVAMVFLLFDTAATWALGDFFVIHLWQGKALLAMIVVPIAFALHHEYARCPTPRRLAMLGAAGIASVGTSTTAMFVIPLVAAGFLLAQVRRRPRVALTGFAATSAYPIGAGLVTLAVGGRTPDVYTNAQVMPSYFLHLALGRGGLAFLAMTAFLVAPAWLPGVWDRRMAAGAALLVGCLLAPAAPTTIFHLLGLGRTLWRLSWALPTAPLVGALAVGILAAHRHAVVRAVPAVLIGGAVVLAGQPVWSAAAGTTVVSPPSWKRTPSSLTEARAIIRLAHPGDVILAPTATSGTILVASGSVTTVNPRWLFLRALRHVPAAHVPDRQRLQRLSMHPSRAVRRAFGPLPTTGEVRHAVSVVGVDLACVFRRAQLAQRRLVAAGLRRRFQTRRLVCLRETDGDRAQRAASRQAAEHAGGTN